MRSFVAALALVAAVALGACGGESDEEKAQKQVCDARADIRKQVDELMGLTAATVSVDGIRSNLSAIRSGLRQMADAQGALSDERRNEVEAATKHFRSSVNAIAADVVSSGSSGDAQAQLRSAAQELRTAYADSLGAVDCKAS